MPIRQALMRTISTRLHGISITVTTVCLVALASGGLVGILASQAYDEYVRSEALAAAGGSNAAQTLATHASLTLGTARLIADTVASSAAQSNGDPSTVRRTARQYVTSVAGISDIAYLDPHGNVRAAVVRERSVVQKALAELVLQDKGSHRKGGFIGRPVRDPLTGQWQVPIVKKVTTSYGAAIGLVVVFVPVSEFTKLYQRLDIGSDSAVVLASTSGVVYARFPAVDRIIGGDFSSSHLFSDDLKDKSSGSVVRRSAVDGVERLYSFARVEGFPLVVAAGVATESFIEEWRSKFIWRGIGVAILFACLLLMGTHIQGRMKKTEEDEVRLNKAHADLENLNRELEKLVMLDPLTGLGNRRKFDQALPTEFARAMRNGSMLAMIMIDVDFFKKFNDRYGHPAGDDCLRIVSAVVQASQSRPGDLAVRYGGEEMAVLLPNTDLAGALTVAEKIRKSVENLQVPHEDSPNGVVTVSIGVNAFVPVRFGHNQQQLIDSADQALYEAKASGRNRVCSGMPLGAPSTFA